MNTGSISAHRRPGALARVAHRLMEGVRDGVKDLPPPQRVRWGSARVRAGESPIAHDVRVSDTADTVLHLHFTDTPGARAGGERRVELTLLAEDGTPQSIRSEQAGPGAAAVVSVAEWCRAEHLALPFAGRVEVAHDSSVAIGLCRRDGDATSWTACPAAAEVTGSFTPDDWVWSRPVMSVPVILGDSGDTELLLDDRCGDRFRDREVIVALHDSTGRAVAHLIENLPAGAEGRISFRSVAELFELDETFVHALVWFGDQACPAGTCADVTYLSADGSRTDLAVATEFLNTDVPPDQGLTAVNASEMFAVLTDGSNGQLVLTNPGAGMEDRAPALVALSVGGLDGTELGATTVSVPADAIMVRELRSLFPDVDFDGDALVLAVKSADAALVGCCRGPSGVAPLLAPVSSGA